MNSPSMSALAGAQRAYARTMCALAAAMMAAITLIMATQVFWRYLLGGSLIWAEEFSRYLLVWVTFLFAGAGFQRGDLVAVEFVTQSVSPKVRRMLLAPAYLITALFLLVIAWHGWIHAARNTSQAAPAFDFIAQALFGVDSGVSIFWVYVSLPLGCAILAIHFLLSTARMVCIPAPAAPPQG